MNISNLTAKEIINYCAPETDLERRIFDHLISLQDDLDSSESALQELGRNQEDCEECDSHIQAIVDSLELIEGGRVVDAAERLRAEL